MHTHCIVVKILVVTPSTVKPEVASSSLVGLPPSLQTHPRDTRRWVFCIKPNGSGVVGMALEIPAIMQLGVGVLSSPLPQQNHLHRFYIAACDQSGEVNTCSY